MCSEYTSLSLKTCSPCAKGGVLRLNFLKKRRSKSQVLSLSTRGRMRMRLGIRRRRAHKVLKMVNLRLYWENKSIMEENKRLRKRALLLRLENKALRTHLQSPVPPLSLSLPPPPH